MMPQGLRFHMQPLHCNVTPPPIKHRSLSVHALKAGLTMWLHLANEMAANVPQAKPWKALLPQDSLTCCTHNLGAADEDARGSLLEDERLWEELTQQSAPHPSTARHIHQWGDPQSASGRLTGQLTTDAGQSLEEASLAQKALQQTHRLWPNKMVVVLKH